MLILPQNAHFLHRYFVFIRNIRALGEREFPEGFETHHIIPRCLGGRDIKTNLIKLTYREHYIAHLILSKCFYGKERTKLLYALFRMLDSSKKVDRQVKFNIYQKKAELFKKYCTGHRHFNYGKARSEETKRKMSEASKGKKRGPHSEETKSKMRGPRTNTSKMSQPKSEETKKKMSEYWSGRSRSELTKQKIKESWIRRKSLLSTNVVL